MWVRRPSNASLMLCIRRRSRRLAACRCWAIWEAHFKRRGLWLRRLNGQKLKWISEARGRKSTPYLRLLGVLLVAVEATAIGIVLVIALRAVLVPKKIVGAGGGGVGGLRSLEEVARHRGLQVEIVHGKHGKSVALLFVCLIAS